MEDGKEGGKIVGVRRNGRLNGPTPLQVMRDEVAAKLYKRLLREEVSK